MLKNVKKILIIKLREIGDVILSTPVIKVLNDNSNLPEITYVLKKGLYPLGKLLPHVKEVITYDKNSLIDTIFLIKKLRKRKFDLAVNLHATFRSALITRLSGAKLRLVHNHSGKDWFTSVPLNIEEKVKSIIERDLDTLAPLNIGKITDSQKKTQLIIKKENSLFLDEEIPEKTIGFGIGASRPVKMWPPEKFIELGKKLSENGCHIAVFCSEIEREMGEYISGEIGKNAILYAGADLMRVAYLISQLSGFIGNDSGMRHMAAALNIKTITLFGPEDPVEWHPYSEREGHYALHKKLDCINCAEYICKNKNHLCMESISPDAVFKTALKVFDI